jgi:hypothetical protein
MLLYDAVITPSDHKKTGHPISHGYETIQVEHF